jgi:hypothetical protein
MNAAWLLSLSGAALLALAGCAKREPPAPVREHPAASASAASKAPSFHWEVLPVLTRHCASAPACHGDDPTDSVHLDLLPAAAHASLLAPAEARRGALRVKPGDPAHSFLVAKMTGTLGPGEGKAMPLDVDTGAPLSPSPVPLDFIRNVLEPWIAAGAPNN